MNLKNLLLIFSIVFLLSCENNEIVFDTNNLLVGNWVEPIYDGESIVFKRGSSLPNKARGFSFTEDGFFTERTSGFCGTPPLTFFDRLGSWILDKNNLKIYDQYITFQVGAQPILWYNYNIVSVSENKLVLKRELTEKEKDHRALIDLFSEIENLAYSKTCANTTNWSFTAYGSKACGGPQGYLPYSKSINVTAFLDKIEVYTEAEKTFNIKWNIVSDCSVINTPKSVECQNEIPILIY